MFLELLPWWYDSERENWRKRERERRGREEREEREKREERRERRERRDREEREEREGREGREKDREREVEKLQTKREEAMRRHLIFLSLFPLRWTSERKLQIELRTMKIKITHGMQNQKEFPAE
jgi:hypothetical protein